MSTVTIELAKIAKDLNRDTISGRETGLDARAELAIDQIEGVDRVEIRVPEHVRVVTPSFFLGLLGPEMARTGSMPAARARFILIGASEVTGINLTHAMTTVLARVSPFDTLKGRPRTLTPPKRAAAG